MTRSLVLIVTISAFLLCGCGTNAPERSASSNGRRIEGSYAANDGIANNAPASNNSDGRPTAIPSPETPAAEVRNKKLKDIRAAGGDPSAPKLDVETLLKKSERPAPEDSLFAVALVDIVVERRTFPKHPTLSKVEKVTGTDGRSSVTVVTRDGRSFELAGDAIGPVSTASSFTILRAAGLEGPTGDGKRRPPAPASKN